MHGVYWAGPWRKYTSPKLTLQLKSCWLQAQLLRHLQEEEQERRGAEGQYSLSGGSTPSNAPSHARSANMRR